MNDSYQLEFGSDPLAAEQQEREDHQHGPVESQLIDKNHLPASFSR